MVCWWETPVPPRVVLEDSHVAAWGSGSGLGSTVGPHRGLCVEQVVFCQCNVECAFLPSRHSAQLRCRASLDNSIISYRKWHEKGEQSQSILNPVSLQSRVVTSLLGQGLAPPPWEDHCIQSALCCMRMVEFLKLSVDVRAKCNRVAFSRVAASGVVLSIRCWISRWRQLYVSWDWVAWRKSVFLWDKMHWGKSAKGKIQLLYTV